MPTSLGPAEILVILVVALIVLGPKRLPEAGRQVGKAIAEVRKWSQGFQDEIRSTLQPEPTRAGSSEPPSYSEAQPGYVPPPIPVVPDETPPPPAESPTWPEAGDIAAAEGVAADTAAAEGVAADTAAAPPEYSNGAGVTTGSHGLVSPTTPVDWADEPTYSDPAPTEPPAPPSGEPPRP